MTMLPKIYAGLFEGAVVLLFLCGCRMTIKDDTHLFQTANNIANEEWLTGNEGLLRLKMSDIGEYPAISFIEQEWGNASFIATQWHYFMFEFYDIEEVIHWKRKKGAIAIRGNNHVCLQSDAQVMKFLNPIPTRRKTISEAAIAMVAALAFGELRGYSVPDPDSHNSHIRAIHVLQQEDGWNVTLPFITDAFIGEVYQYSFHLHENGHFIILGKKRVAGAGYM